MTELGAEQREPEQHHDEERAGECDAGPVERPHGHGRGAAELTLPRVIALWGASMAYLVLVAMALLVVGLWSVPLIVLLTALPCLALVLLEQQTWTEVRRRVAR